MILKIFLMSLFCVGIRKVTDEGMIFFFIKKFLNDHIKNEAILNPIINCIYCFASVWGSIAYILLSFIIGYEINAIEWIYCCICCVFVNGFLWNLLIKIES